MATADGNGGRRGWFAQLFVDDLVSINLFFGLSIDSFNVLLVLDIGFCLLVLCIWVWVSETNLAATLMCLDSPNIIARSPIVRYSTSPPASTSPCSFDWQCAEFSQNPTVGPLPPHPQANGSMNSQVKSLKIVRPLNVSVPVLSARRQRDAIRG